MKEIRIEKITLNMGVGSPGDKLTRAKNLLEKISGLKSVETKTMKRIPTWGLRPRLAIGCKVTIRGNKAEDLLVTLLKALESKLSEDNFDESGNFSFGIKEYIDIPGVEYIPELGIVGLEAAVTLERPGFRIKRRIRSKRIPFRHKIQKHEAIDFVKNKYNILVIKEEEA